MEYGKNISLRDIIYRFTMRIDCYLHLKWSMKHVKRIACKLRTLIDSYNDNYGLLKEVIIKNWYDII